MIIIEQRISDDSPHKSRHLVKQLMHRTFLTSLAVVTTLATHAVAVSLPSNPPRLSVSLPSNPPRVAVSLPSNPPRLAVSLPSNPPRIAVSLPSNPPRVA